MENINNLNDIEELINVIKSNGGIVNNTSVWYEGSDEDVFSAANKLISIHGFERVRIKPFCPEPCDDPGGIKYLKLIDIILEADGTVDKEERAIKYFGNKPEALAAMKRLGEAYGYTCYYSRPISHENLMEVNYERLYDAIHDAEHPITEEPRPSGLQRVAQERLEQLHKHYRSIEYDIRRNDGGQLKQVSYFAAFADKALGFLLYTKPHGWDEEYLNRLAKKSEKDRLIIAAALLLAEYDRLDELEYRESQCKK